MRVEQKQVLSAARQHGGVFTAMELVDLMYPGREKSERRNLRQRVLCHLAKLVDAGELYRQPSEGKEVLWGLSKPDEEVKRIKRHMSPDEIMVDSVILRLQRHPGGMTLNDLLDDIYGVGVKIDAVAYSRIKNALRILEAKGRVIRTNNGSKFGTWILVEE